jgi:hypothetical protein
MWMQDTRLKRLRVHSLQKAQTTGAFRFCLGLKPFFAMDYLRLLNGGFLVT